MNTPKKMEKGPPAAATTQHDHEDNKVQNLSRDPFRVGGYIIGRHLGSGSFSRVFTCLDAEDNVYAMKITNRVQELKLMDSIVLREVAITKSLDHPFILKLHDVLKSKRHFYFVMEPLYGGNLAKEITNCEYFSEDRARFFFQQVIVGIRYMHSKRIAHRDLKVQNVLLDEYGNLRICDFGLSTLQIDGMQTWTTCGTIAYMPPEVSACRGYDAFCADIWGCGCILFHMLMGIRPFWGENPRDLRNNILTGRTGPFLDSVSESARDLIRRMLTPSTTDRITIAGILRHPWFRKGFDSTWLDLED